MPTFLLTAGPFIIRPSVLGSLAIPLSSLTAMVFAGAFVIAWHWERIGAWIAVVCGVTLTFWFTVRLGQVALSPFDLLLWTPA